MTDELKRQLGMGQGSMAHKEREYTLEPQPTWYGKTEAEWLATPIVPHDAD